MFADRYKMGLQWSDVAERMKKTASKPAPTSHDAAFNEESIEQDPAAEMMLGDYVPAQDPKYAFLLTLSSPRPTYEKGIALLEKSYNILEQAEDINKGKVTEKNLGAAGTIAAEKKKIADEADYLRKAFGERDSKEMNIMDWQNVRDLMFMALNQYAAINEGRAYQNKVFDQFITDLGTNAKNLGKGAVSYGKWVLIGLGGLVAVKLVSR